MRIAIRRAIIAITTNNSISVKAFGAFIVMLVFSCMNRCSPVAEVIGTLAIFNLILLEVLLNFNQFEQNSPWSDDR